MASTVPLQDASSRSSTRDREAVRGQPPRDGRADAAGGTGDDGGSGLGHVISRVAGLHLRGSGYRPASRSRTGTAGRIDVVRELLGGVTGE